MAMWKIQSKKNVYLWIYWYCTVHAHAKQKTEHKPNGMWERAVVLLHIFNCGMLRHFVWMFNAQCMWFSLSHTHTHIFQSSRIHKIIKEMADNNTNNKTNCTQNHNIERQMKKKKRITHTHIHMHTQNSNQQQTKWKVDGWSPNRKQENEREKKNRIKILFHQILFIPLCCVCFFWLVFCSFVRMRVCVWMYAQRNQAQHLF